MVVEFYIFADMTDEIRIHLGVLKKEKGIIFMDSIILLCVKRCGFCHGRFIELISPAAPLRKQGYRL